VYFVIQNRTVRSVQGVVRVVVSFYTSETIGIVRIHQFIVCSCLSSDIDVITGVLLERSFAIHTVFCVAVC
jgi:hypothetical protein